jgi:hypothetical protein
MLCPYAHEEHGDCAYNEGHAGPHSYAHSQVVVGVPAPDEAGWGNGATVIGGVFSMQLPEGDKGRLMAWWLNTALCDFNDTMPKAEEYGGATGSADLEIVGDNIAKLMGWDDASSAMLQELGCWFYAQGKLARLVSDYQQQRPGKPDTLKDANVYVMMMRRIQESGRWPG